LAKPLTKNQRAFQAALDLANERLAQAKRKTRINQPTTEHRTLFLRATLPPKPGDPRAGNTQQRIQIPCEASAKGLIEAEALALKLHEDIARWKLTGEEFDWGSWIDLKPRVRSDERESFGSVIERFEAHWRAQRHPDPDKPWAMDRYWRDEFAVAFNRLDPEKPYSVKALEASVKSTAPKSRVRRRQARVCRLLAEFQGETAECCRKLAELGAGYGLRQLDPRMIPADTELLRVVEAVPERFRWMFRVLFLYGCRPHEVYGAECDGELFLEISQGKTGPRASIPVPSQQSLVRGWEMAGNQVPQTIAKRSKNPPLTLQLEINRQLNLLGVEWDAYVFRHAWAHRAIREGFPIKKAALSLGNSQAVFEGVYARWLAKEALREVLAS